MISTVRLIALAVAFVASPVFAADPLTQDEIENFRSLLETAQNDQKHLAETVQCLSKYDQDQSAKRNQLQTRSGELHEKLRDVILPKYAEAKVRVELQKAEAQRREQDQAITLARLNEARAKMEAEQKTLNDCRNTFGWASGLICAPVELVTALVVLVNNYEADYNTARQRFRDASEAARSAQSVYQKAATALEQAEDALAETNAELEQVSTALADVKAHLASARDVSFDYQANLNDFSNALREAMDHDLEATSGRIVRRVRLEFEELNTLRTNSTELLNGNGVTLKDGKTICTIG